MSARIRPAALALSVLVMMAARPVGELRAQLPSPAADAAEAFLRVIRSGDGARLQAFYEARYTQELLDVTSMDQHLAMGAFFREDLEDRETVEVELLSPYEVSMILAGPEDRLELRLRVEPDPPHRIEGLTVGEAGPAISATSLDELGAELRRLADGDELSGVVLVADSGGILLHEAYGLADRASGRPNQPGTRFDIGSLGKLFTATAILRLTQDRRLDLSDPLGRYMDGFPRRVAEGVTIQHLLTHRAGFGDYLDHPAFQADPKAFDEPADFLRLARGQDLHFEPGTNQRYSNLGFVLLGAVLEDVTELPYHEVVSELVFRPARMTSAGSTGAGGSARRYHPARAGLVPVDSIYPDVGSPAGGSFASAMDLHRFFDALLAHELLSAENTALLLNDFERADDDTSLPEQVGYSGGAPGVSAMVLNRPASGRSVVILANVDTLPLGPLARRIMGMAWR